MRHEAPENALAAQWLDKAARDLAGAQLVAGAEPPLRDLACFHCQQAAEKALKALLVSHAVVVRRTHNLELLLEECCELKPELIELRAQAAFLTLFGSDVRYPSFAEPTAEETLRALHDASLVFEAIVRQLSSV
jgi:HEPN domain-containing protein